jgi:hypothetical protein
MTMQIAIVATDGIVLASDTKYRPTQRQFTDNPNTVPSGIVNATKVWLCQRHNIAVAFAGWSDEVILAGKELAEHLNSIATIDDGNIRGVLAEWGNAYYDRARPGSSQANGPLLQLLVVRPSDQHPIVKLCVNRRSATSTSTGYMVNGHESNTAIFWPEYAKAADGCDLAAATAIAATTILMGAKINDHGIGGLEVWRYKKRWEPVPTAEIEERFEQLRVAIEKMIYPDAVDKGKFDGVLRSLINSRPTSFKDAVAQPKFRKDGSIKQSARKSPASAS